MSDRARHAPEEVADKITVSGRVQLGFTLNLVRSLGNESDRAEELLAWPPRL